MEVYSDFCGHCLATGNAIRKGKMEIGMDAIAMAKAASDNIDVLSRFKGRSEPVFLFIFKGKLTRAMFGANGIELCRIIEEELGYVKKETETGVERPKRDIQEMLPEEAVKLEEDLLIEKEIQQASERLRTLTLASRKKRVCERLSRSVQRLNYILFWPHCHQAHYDLYEKWDIVNIQVAAKDTFQLKQEDVKEVLYMSDVEPNEACVYALLKGEVLVVLFKMFDTDNRNFIKLMRHALYEEIPVPKEDVPPEKQVPPIPAYERYATISKTAREVRRDRYNVRMQKLREEREERERLAAEQARLAREAEEERLRQEKQRQEEERMARIQAGLPAEPEPEDVGEEGVEGEEKEEGEGEKESTVAVEEEEEKVEQEEEFHSDVEIEDEEYIPPGGLFVPGLYSPPNELAKANALAFFFPKIVQELATIESEYLPPHVLVMFPIDKRQEVQEVIAQYPDEILATGIFVGEDLHSAEHIAYTIKQYNKMERPRRHKDRLALMVSRRRSLALLQLAGLNPCYISSDLDSGEKDCLSLFPVGYGDDYEEEETLQEEEVEEVVVAEPEPEPVVAEEEKEKEDEDDED
ncbi:golgin subfamily A member 6-like protein 6 isoform X2 [Amyelois transitella]|nr:golgin subfamily A member 6-like protein 6 isoform X2 [Amyelois transitella]